MTSRTASILPTLLLAAILAGSAYAQPVQDQQAGVAATGEVVAIDAKAGTLTVRDADGKEAVFQVGAKTTTVMSGSQEVGLAGLHKGEWITIDGDRKGGKTRATYVEVVEDPEPDATKSKAMATAASATIEVRHNSLSPASVQIGAGQSVTFHNLDKMPGGHTVVATDGAFSSPPLDKGATWSHSFDVPGVYPVRIKEHPSAEATIIVE